MVNLSHLNLPLNILQQTPHKFNRDLLISGLFLASQEIGIVCSIVNKNRLEPFVSKETYTTNHLTACIAIHVIFDEERIYKVNE